MSGLFAVITTIQPPTAAVESLAERLEAIDATLVVAGDQKGPAAYDLGRTRFLSLRDQLASDFELARLGPVGHYTRKNIGYLEVIRRGADCIYETDDDNAPLADWAPREEWVDAHRIDARGWANVYRCFTTERIWPRGLPLDEVLATSAQPKIASSMERVRAPLQQGLANGSPDVDAVWRLVLDRPFDFDDGPSVVLASGSWCPFNSQSTWWWPDAYALMYLPSFCSFRMTDIWRSFVAQRCLWELGLGVVFHSAEVVQDRNQHDLMRDFSDEIPGYLGNRRLVEVLESLPLKPGEGYVAENLARCYRGLVAAEIFPEAELALVDAWIAAVAKASE
jgi:hypothetical protein